MEAHHFFLQLLIMLMTARVLGELAARFKIPSVIGEMSAGILLGPSLLGWLEPGETIRLLAAIGIILLLFEVGLETDMQRLVRTGAKSFMVALTGFVLPFLLGYGVSAWVFGLATLPALFIGGTLTATSIGITVRVLADLKRQQSHEAQIVLGAAVIDDILGVILLALLYDFSRSGSVDLGNTGKVTLFIALFLVLSPVAAKLIARVIKRFDDRSEIPGLIPTTMVSILLLFAWIAHGVGAPELLGGFAAGLALSRQFFLPLAAFLRADHDFAHRIETQMRPIVHLFTPIFFVMVGLSLNLRAVDWGSPLIWGLSLSLLAAAFVGKIASGFLVARENIWTRFAIGLAMVPRGEVGLIFAELGRTSGILNDTVYAALIIVIALTTLLPPFLLRGFYGVAGERLVAAPPAGI